MATENGDSLVGRKEEGKEEEEVVGKVQKLSTSEETGPMNIDPELATKADEWKEIANIKFKGDLYVCRSGLNKYGVNLLALKFL